jgi:hypothetical protein
MKRKKWIIIGSLVVLVGFVLYWGGNTESVDDVDGSAPHGGIVADNYVTPGLSTNDGLQTANTGNSNPTGNDPTVNDPVENDPTENWIKVASLTGTVDKRESTPFTLNGGEVKIVSRITPLDSGGNGLVYLLEEGSTTSRDTDGKIRVASFEQSVIAFSDKEVERSVITQKEAGSWYIQFNSTKLEKWSVDIYELA